MNALAVTACPNGRPRRYQLMKKFLWCFLDGLFEKTFQLVFSQPVIESGIALFFPNPGRCRPVTLGRPKTGLGTIDRDGSFSCKRALSFSEKQ